MKRQYLLLTLILGVLTIFACSKKTDTPAATTTTTTSSTTSSSTTSSTGTVTRTANSFNVNNTTSNPDVMSYLFNLNPKAGEATGTWDGTNANISIHDGQAVANGDTFDVSISGTVLGNKTATLYSWNASGGSSSPPATLSITFMDATKHGTGKSKLHYNQAYSVIPGTGGGITFTTFNNATVSGTFSGTFVAADDPAMKTSAITLSNAKFSCVYQ